MDIGLVERQSRMFANGADLQRTLDQMELALEIACVRCARCGAVEIFPGVSRIIAFTCRKCGEVVNLADDQS